MLKKRETSFSQEQLDDGKKLIERVVKAVETKTKKEGVENALAKPSRVSKISGEIQRTVSRLKRAQVKTILENFQVFRGLFEETAVKEKVVLPDPLKGDRFYVPKKHNYR